MSEIRVERLRKEFGPVVALDDVDFTFPEGKVTCLLGPSGCGKTTLMRIVAGLERPTRGQVFFGPNRVTDLPPRKRFIGMVFQYPVVYRGISVYENIELPLKSDKLAKEERKRRVDDVIQLLGLEAAAGKDITQLDNGTRQKVAVAREVARQPRIILFDEPITNVDTEAKLQLKRAFKELTRRLEQTIVYVTHDQTEAMTLADQIALMQDGRIVQCDRPRELYNHPADVFGGWFLGNPGMTFFDATLDAAGQGAFTMTGALFPTPIPVALPPDGAGGSDGSQTVTVGIRPERIVVRSEPAPRAVEARLLRKAISVGRQYLLTIAAGDKTFKAKVAPTVGQTLEPGPVWIELPPDRLTVFDEHGRRLDARFPVAATAA